MTSRATRHLRDFHRVVSEKTHAENDRKFTPQEECSRLMSSRLFVENPSRVRQLLETLRIVNNNLPYRLGEYEESEILNEIVMKDHMKVFLNAKSVSHSIVKLYASTRRVIAGYLSDNHTGGIATSTLVADFWTPKTKRAKYLGLRLYLIDNDWQVKSILLGTRQFNTLYGDRDQGLRSPFERWLMELLKDFGLSKAHLFGATSDAGSNVKWMLLSGFELRWQWCVAHLTNAATKMACGLIGDPTTSKNMTSMLCRITKTIMNVRTVEVMGSLFRGLCEFLGNTKQTKLLDYKSHRFMGLTSVLQRIVRL